MSKVFASMAASLDGYIATRNGDLSWLNQAISSNEDYGFAENMKRTGAYIVGANTYREIVNSGRVGNSATKTYVVTHHTSIGKPNPNVSFYSGDLRALLERIKAETDKDICLFGGGDLVTQSIDLDLVDEVEISIIPILLGDGVPFFGKIKEWKRLLLSECRQYKSGIVLLNYRFMHRS